MSATALRSSALERDLCSQAECLGVKDSLVCGHAGIRRCCVEGWKVNELRTGTILNGRRPPPIGPGRQASGAGGKQVFKLQPVLDLECFVLLPQAVFHPEAAPVSRSLSHSYCSLSFLLSAMSSSAPADPERPASPRSATSYSSFNDDDDGRRSHSHEFDSESALILVNDHDDPDASPFEFSSDDDEREDEDDQPGSVSVASLSSLSVFLYLLSPLLKLGALLATFDIAQLPLKLALPGLFFFAGLCAFSRQIWYMLSRYVRRTDIEEVFLDAFAKGRGRERRRYIVRMSVRFSTALLRVLLAAVYLRCTSPPVLLLMSAHPYVVRL